MLVNAALGVAAHAVPDHDDVAAGGVDELHALFVEHAAHGDGEAEGGDDDDVFGGEGAVGVVVGVPGQVAQAEGVERGVDFGVVDDFADEPDALALEHFAGGVGDFDGAAHAVAEAELGGEAQLQARQAQGGVGLAVGWRRRGGSGSAGRRR